MAHYGRVEYWDDRYRATSANGPYEWYQNYASLRHLLVPETLRTSSSHEFPPRNQCRVLILGCGNSSMGEDMKKDGWTGPMVQVDFSSVVIEQMKARHEHTAQTTGAGSAGSAGGGDGNMTFLCTDIAEGLPFHDCTFDLIIMKGTLDSILCSKGSTYNAKRVIRECVRLLDGGGVLFLVTYGNPDSRVVFLEYDDPETNTHDLSRWWQEVSTNTVFRKRDTGMGSGPSGGRGGGSYQQASKKDFVYICRKVRDNHLVGNTGSQPNSDGAATNAATGIASDPSAKFAQMALVGK